MSNNEDENARRRAEALVDGKDIEFHSQACAAWFNSSLEFDKSLLTLSSAAIGFLVTFTEKLISSSIWSFSIYSLAVLSFLCSIMCTLTIFKKNPPTIVETLSKEKSESSLDFFDRISYSAFCVGMILSVVLGLMLAGATFDQKKQEDVMSRLGKSGESSNSPTTKADANAGNVGKFTVQTNGIGLESFGDIKNLQNVTQSTAAQTPQSVGQSGQQAPATSTTSSTTKSAGQAGTSSNGEK